MKLKIFILLTWGVLFIRLNAQDISLLWDKEYQTISANGINFEGYNKDGGDEVLDAKFDRMMRDLPSGMVRLGIPLKVWEPANDNSDPFIQDADGFKDVAGAHYSFLRLREMKDRGMKIWLSLWDVADWMVTNPSDDYARRIANFDELGECLLTYLLQAKYTYGVEVDYISVNEPTIAGENGWGGYQIALSLEEQKELISRTGRLFKDNGMNTEWILGLHKVYPSERQYALDMLADTSVSKFISGVDFHGYSFQRGHDEDLKAWGEILSSLDMEAFVGECDYDNKFWENPAYNSWNGPAVETGLLDHKMLVLTHANGIYPWYPYERPYRQVHRHFMDAFRPGTIIMGAASDDPSIIVTAGKQIMHDSLIVVIQNTSAEVKTVRLTHMPNETFTHIQSTGGSYYTVQPEVAVHQRNLILELPPYSLHTLKGRGGALPVSYFSVSDDIGYPPFEVHFDGTRSYDPVNDSMATYRWDFGDGITDTTAGPVVNHIYSIKGVFHPKLTVVSQAGHFNESTRTIYAAAYDSIMSTDTVPVVDGIPDSFWSGGKELTLIQRASSAQTQFSEAEVDVSLAYTHTYLYILARFRDSSGFTFNEWTAESGFFQLCFDPGNDKNLYLDQNDCWIRLHTGGTINASGNIEPGKTSMSFSVEDTVAFLEASIPWKSLGIDPEDQLLLGFESVFQWNRSGDSMIWTWNSEAPEYGMDPSRYGLIRLSEDPDHLPNHLPSVRIARPFKEERYAHGNPVSVIAYTDDQDLSDVACVNVYLNDTLIGVDTSGNSRSVFTLYELPEGTYTISASVRDHHGEFGDEGEVTFYVEAPAGGGAVSDSAPLVRLYPNPASNWVKFEFGHSTMEGAMVCLMDASGRILNKQKISENSGSLLWSFELDRSKLDPGLYMVQFTFPGSHGNVIGTYKLVLE